MESKEIAAITISIFAVLLSFYNVFVGRRLSNRLNSLSIDDNIFELLKIIIETQTIRESTLTFIRKSMIATNKNISDVRSTLTPEIEKSIKMVDACENFIIEKLKSDKSIEEKIRSMTNNSIVNSKLIIATNKLRGEVKSRFASAKLNEAEVENIILNLKTQIPNLK